MAFEGAGKAKGDQFDLRSIDADLATPEFEAFLGGNGKGRLSLANSGSNTIVRAIERRCEFQCLIQDADEGPRPTPPDFSWNLRLPAPQDGEEGGAEALDLLRAHALDALERVEGGGAGLGDPGERRRGAVERLAEAVGAAGEGDLGGVEPIEEAAAAAGRRAGGGPGGPAAGAAPVRTARKLAPKRSSLTAPTPVMPAQRVERLRAAGGHLDQRAVGEDDVGGDARRRRPARGGGP